MWEITLLKLIQTENNNFILKQNNNILPQQNTSNKRQNIVIILIMIYMGVKGIISDFSFGVIEIIIFVVAILVATFWKKDNINKL
ncbi:hypothetical protein CAPN001_03190 [Capnocytophaga stomatis]|nr:hypothetical protein CAPN001_03190 [Capnocytophaga stomatis]